MTFVCNPLDNNDLEPSARPAFSMGPVCEGDAPKAPSTPEQPAGNGGNTAVAEPPAKTKTQPQKPRLDQLPPYQVLLHNDDINDMLYVVRTVIEITPLNKERALEVTFEAHLSGVAMVLVTHKERAELYRDQFQSKGLTATIEPV